MADHDFNAILNLDMLSIDRWQDLVLHLSNDVLNGKPRREICHHIKAIPFVIGRINLLHQDAEVSIDLPWLLCRDLIIKLAIHDILLILKLFLLGLSGVAVS